jgi:hypothetical protein
MRRYKKELGEDDVHRALSMAADLYREVGADQGLSTRTRSRISSRRS